MQEIIEKEVRKKNRKQNRAKELTKGGDRPEMQSLKLRDEG